MKKFYIQTNQSRLEVVPERGGIITSWRVQNQEILYLDEERFANPQLSVRGGIPILFPICGNLPNNTYTLNDKQYTLKQHGFARDLPWEFIEDQVTPEKASLTLALSSNEQTRAVYPFEFKLAFTYQIQGNTLEIRQKYTNLSTEQMPFSTGLHPYFLTVDKNQLKFEIPSQEYQDQITKEIHLFNGDFDYNRDEIDVAFKQLNGKSATVTDNARKLKLKLEYDDTYSTLVFWTVIGKDYYCLEPWSAARNALNTGERLSVLEPEASHTATVRLTANFF
ncbi:MAG: aldose epimerase [Iphinoe sp. HA4291-MV1]|nr:aldose epimerase [Iphinoe sp. HA4291-MV1]